MPNWGGVMTRAATVVRHNDELAEACAAVEDLDEQARHCSLSDTGNWLNQNAVFARALGDMFPLAKAILRGGAGPRRVPRRPLQARVRHARSRRGRHGRAPAAQAEQWVDRFEENTRRWLKTTVAELSADGQPALRYEDVDSR